MIDFSSIDGQLAQLHSVLARSSTPEGQPHAAQPARPPGAAQPSHAAQPEAVQPAPAAEPEPAAGFHAPGTARAQDLAEYAVIGPAETKAKAIVAAAQVEAARLIEDARSQVRDLSRQIDDLISLRDQLMDAPVAGAPAPIAADVATAPILSEASPSGPSHFPPPIVVPGAAPPQTSAPPIVVPAAAATSAAPIVVPAADGPAASAPPIVVAATDAPPVTPAPPLDVPAAEIPPAPVPPAFPSPAPPVFAEPRQPAVDPERFGSVAGLVTVTVGPFSDTAAIERFERAVMTLAVEDVYLRAYESGRAIFELTLHHPAPLVDELVRAHPEPIAVIQESPRELVITLGGQSLSGSDGR